MILIACQHRPRIEHGQNTDFSRRFENGSKPFPLAPFVRVSSVFDPWPQPPNLLVEQAAEHLSGVQVDAAVVWMLLFVKSHHGSPSCDGIA
jgi:hypothetical protein